LNVSSEEITDDEDVEDLCSAALQVFPSLRKLRIFNEDGMETEFWYGGLSVEYATFSFGDVIYLD